MILVTGGLGFIGAHTARALLDGVTGCILAQRSTRVVPEFLTADLGGPGRVGEAGRCVVERVDCTDLGSLLALGERYDITGVVHLAAAGAGGDVLDQLRENTSALLNVLRLAQASRVRRVVLASTIGVYAGSSAAHTGATNTGATNAYREDVPLPMASAHPIPAAKKSAEILAGAVADGTGLEVVSARIGAIWGPLGRDVSPFFGAPQLIHAAVRGGPTGVAATTVPALFAEDGIDMCYVRDCGRAIAALQTAEVLRHRAYNVGSGVVTTNRAVADAVARVIPGAASALSPGRSPHAPARDAHLDTTRLRTDTGFAPAYDLDSAVADYVKWLRAANPR